MEFSFGILERENLENERVWKMYVALLAVAID